MIAANGTWLVLGSAPSARDALPTALAERPDSIITTNDGIDLCAEYKVQPTVYYIADPEAFGKFHAQAIAAQQAGTHIVGMARDMGFPANVMLLKYGLRENELLEVDRWRGGVGSPPRWRGEEPFILGNNSGLICLQYALHRHASRVLMVGLDGYRPGLGTWRGGKRDGHRPALQVSIFTPFLASCVAYCPHVRFEQWGDPAYTIEADNYTLHRVQPQEAMQCG